MFVRPKLLLFLTLCGFAVPAGADSLVYVVTTNTNQFGTLDLTTGAFHHIGPGATEGETGLINGPNGSLLTLTVSGNLDSINPATGVATVIGPTGLANCATPASPCGPTSPNGSVANSLVGMDSVTM